MSNTTMFRVGIDIGGTFTDLVALAADGRTYIAKVATTKPDQSIGFSAGLAAIAKIIGIEHKTFLDRIEVIIHGTTAATNALLERRGAKTGLITTEGFIDVIEQREGYKPERYDIRLPPDAPIIPRNLRLGVRERIRADGTTETPLDEVDAERAIRTLKENGVEAISIALLNSYLQPAHEIRIAEIAARIFPEAYLSLSSRVLPVMKEYQRFSTTVVNSYVGPILRQYLGRLLDRVRADGYDGEILIMHSHGGLASIEASIALAAGCVLSGPAGGVAGAIAASAAKGVPDLISFDMGGTSTDIALVVDGRASITTSREINGLEVSLPSVDVLTIGSGGGSVAAVGVDGLLRVGPESAGSDPGPACYGRGGTKATTTDANFVLGYYDPQDFMGGRITCDPEAARAAIEDLARSLGCSMEEAASGVLQIVGTQMAEGIRIAAVRAGRDPRRHALLSFGGAAGLHIAQIARNLGITAVIVPPAASVFSAWGMLESDMRFERVRNISRVLQTGTSDAIRAVIADMRAELQTEIATSPDSRVKITLNMRYGEQIFEIPVEFDGQERDVLENEEAIGRRFRAHHKSLYGYAPEDQEIVVANVRFSLTCVGPKSAEGVVRDGGVRDASARAQRVYLDGKWQSIPVWSISVGQSDRTVEGPCLLRSATTSILLGDGDRGVIGADRWITLEIKPKMAQSPVTESALESV